MKKKTSILLGILPLMLASCGIGNSNNEKPTIYTSFYPIYDFTCRIVKDKFNVVNITPAGSEPHDYDLSTSDVVGMTEASYIFTNGIGLESWTDTLPNNLSEKVYEVTEGIDILSINGTKDPHVWLNPLNAIKEMENIKNYLCQNDSSNASFYLDNFENAKYLFTSFDSSFESTVNSFTNKNLVVSHAALGYFCDRYSLNQIYIDGLSPDDEPNAQAISSIISAVKEYNVSTIFYEELVSDAIAKTIASETGAECESFNPLEGLSKDELPYEDYVSVMTQNVRKFEKACK
ncbi:MAG: zinc ABC transporter substrate-binding protein [Bacilli bacterium]